MRAALERTYNAVHHNPGEAHQARLVALLQKLNKKVLELQTLEAEVIPEADPITFGEPVRVRLVVTNVSGRRLTIPAKRRGSSRAMLVFDVVRREYDVRASVVTSRFRILRPIRDDLELPAGGRAAMRVNLGPLGNDRPLGGFRTYEISGLLRPTWTEVGGIRRWEAVPLAAGRLRSFRPNYEHLLKEPVDRVGQAIAKNAPVHLLTACALVPPGQRREAVDILVAALRGDRNIDWAIFGALNYLCQVELGRDPQAWKAWWPRVRDTFFEVPAPRRDPDVPTFDAG
jgi:hypothetical protein